jgi:hypothetical protein
MGDLIFSTRATSGDASTVPTERMRILSDGKVGIGDTSPAEALQVAGNIRINNNGIIRADGTGYLQLGNTDGGDIRVFGDGSSSRIQAHGNHLYLQTNRDADDIIFAVNKGGTDSDSTVVEVMRIVGSDGNVGIGTTSPETVLHLETSSGQIAQLGTGNTAYSMHFADDRAMFGHVGGFATVQGGSGGKAVRFCVNNGTFGSGEVARFDTSGNFGIGTTAPDQKLHVEGSILADAYNHATTTLASNYTDGATSMVLTDASEFPTAGSGTINGVAFTWTNKSSNTLTVPDLDASYTAGVTVVADTGLFFRDGFENVAQPSVTIYDKDNSGASRDDLSINANAGIRFRLGNESQMQLTADQLSLTTGNQGAAAIFGFRDRADMGIKSNTSYSVGVLAPDNVFIQTDSNNNGNANYIDFGHGSSTVGSAESMMRIVMGGTTGPGKVGIGTTSPTGVLHVTAADTSAEAFRVDITDSDSTADSTPFVVDGNGRVGIGTASPVTDMALTLNGDGTSYEGIAFQVGGANKWKLQTDGAAFYHDSQVNTLDYNLRLRDSTGAYNTMNLNADTAGTIKMGLGVSPVPLLHVKANNSTTNQTTAGVASITVEQDGTGDAALNFLLTGTRRWIAGIDNSDGDKFKISTGGTDLQTGTKLTIDTSGNAVIAGDVQAATASITGLMTSGTALINSSHSFSNTPAITTNGATINGTNTTKVRAESSTYSFSQSYTLVGNLNNSTELELFRFNVTNASYRKFQAGRMFIRVQVTNPQSGGSGFFQQTVTFGDDASAGAAQSTTDRIDSSMTGGNAAYDHEKATIVVSRVSDYICVKFRNETGVAILTSSGFQAQLSCELFELDAMPS